MIRLAHRCLPLTFTAASLGLVLLVAASQAQKAQTRIGSTGNLELKKDWDKDKEEAKQFEALRRGDQPVTDDAKSILDNAPCGTPIA